MSDRVIEGILSVEGDFRQTNGSSFADWLAAHDREVAATAKAAIIQRLRDTAHSCRPDSTHNAVADWLEREDFGVPVGTEKEAENA